MRRFIGEIPNIDHKYYRNVVMMIVEAYFDRKCCGSDDSILSTRNVATMIVLSCFDHKHCRKDDCANG